MKFVKRALALLVCFSCLVTALSAATYSAENVANDGSVDDLAKVEEASKAGSYFKYYEKYSKETHPDETITLASIAQIGTAKVSEADGDSGLELGGNSDYAEWNFTVDKTGVYSLYSTYYPLEATGKDIQLSVELDGKIPYTEAEELSLPRVWADKKETEDGTFAKDNNGNELRPEQIEAPRWNTRAFSDVLGMYSKPYLFYLEAGVHTIKVECTHEALLLKELVFKNEEKPVSYKEYVKKYEDKEVKGEAIRQEAEKAFEKSTATRLML